MSSPGRVTRGQAHAALTRAGASPSVPRESHVGQHYLHLGYSVGKVARLARGPEARSGAGRRRHTQLDAINKTFIQTTAVQGTIQIKKKKKGKETGKIFSALYIFIQVLRFCVYIHPLSMESPGFEIF